MIGRWRVEGKEGGTHSDGVHGYVVSLAVGDGLQQLRTVMRFSISDHDHHLLSSGPAASLEPLRPARQRLMSLCVGAWAELVSISRLTVQR